MVHLTNLVLEDNSISDISVVSSLVTLHLLALEGNDITDIGPLVDNLGLGAGDNVRINDNPIDCGGDIRYSLGEYGMPAERGVDLVHDCD